MRNLDTLLKSDKMEKIYDKYSLQAGDIKVIQDILNMEWDFFDEVQGLNGRASCQDDSNTFVVMRLAQHLAFPSEVRTSILTDYKNMREENINPIEGKYARMMLYTDEEIYAKLLDRLPGVSPIKRQVIVEIVKILEKDLIEFKEKYPVTMSHSRPMQSEEKNVSSLEYFYAELTFFSYRSLRLMEKYLEKEIEKSLVEDIISNTVILNEYLS